MRPGRKAGHRHRGQCHLHRHSGILDQSGTGAFLYRTGSPYSGTGLVPASAFCSFRYQTDWMPDSPTFRHLKKRYSLHVHTASGRKGHTLHVHTASIGGGEKEPMQCTSKLQAVKSSKFIQLVSPRADLMVINS